MCPPCWRCGLVMIDRRELAGGHQKTEHHARPCAEYGWSEISAQTEVDFADVRSHPPTPNRSRSRDPMGMKGRVLPVELSTALEDPVGTKTERAERARYLQSKPADKK